MQGQRYQRQDQLGKGGMGTVYRAYDKITGQAVALKRLEIDPVQIELNPAMASLDWQHLVLAREFRLMAALRHPNIATVLEYGFMPNGKPFLVMELLEDAQTLGKAAAPLEMRGKVDLLIQALQAIAYLHRHGILHRDLKPSNIMVLPDGLVKVLDFGIAIKRTDRQDIAGTIHYMSPEVINGSGAVEQSDLYAMGVIAYEMFTGHIPFEADSFSEIARRIMQEIPDITPFYVEDNPELGKIAEVIDRLLAKNPTDRYPDALAAIRAFCEAIGDPLPPEEGAIRESFIQAAKFVGREAELAQLKTALKNARAGNGSLWLVSGESGIGKSRLLDELKIHALASGLEVVRGQATEKGGFPGRFWGDALRPLLLSIPVNDEAASLIKETMPDISRIIERDIPDHPAPTIEAFAEAIASTLSRVTHPVLMVLEDIQWAGENLEVLRWLEDKLAHLPLLIVASYRTEEGQTLPAAFPRASLLPLSRFSEQDIAELSLAMLGQAGRSPQVLDLLRRETEGNAFFMVEVVRALAEEAGQLEAVDHIELPESIVTGGIERILERRLKRVPNWAYGGLQVAAVIGRRLDLPVLDRVLSPLLKLVAGKDIAVSISTVWREERALNINDWLLVCADAGIIEIDEAQAWRFSHDKLREHLYTHLTDAQRQMLEKQIARARG